MDCVIVIGVSLTAHELTYVIYIYGFVSYYRLLTVEHEQHVPGGRAAPYLSRAQTSAVQRGEERPRGTRRHQLPPSHRPEDRVRGTLLPGY